MIESLDLSLPWFLAKSATYCIWSRYVYLIPGEWKVSLYCHGKLVDSCPIDVCDPSQVKVTGLKGGLVNKKQHFTGRHRKLDIGANISGTFSGGLINVLSVACLKNPCSSHILYPIPHTCKLFHFYIIPHCISFPIHQLCLLKS